MSYASSGQEAPVSPWGACSSTDGLAAPADHHARAVASLPGKWVAMPMRFGGRSSRLHEITLKFGEMEHDGTVPGHLVAQTAGGPVAARRAVAWDPLLQAFRVDDRYEVESLFRQLAPFSALCGSLSRGLLDKVGSVLGVMAEMFVPRFFVVGGIGAILIAYVFYYYLWFFLLEFLLVYVLLPGVAVAFGAGMLHGWRKQQLHDAMFQAAWHAYDPEAYHAPR